MDLSTRFDPHVRGLARHAEGIADSIQAITSCLVDVVERGGESDQASRTLRSSAEALALRLSNSTRNLRDCLDDVLSMSMAMSPVLSSTDGAEAAAPALMINIYSTLTRQLAGYYAEMDACYMSYAPAFHKGRADYTKSRTEPSAPTSEPQASSSAEAASQSTSQAIRVDSRPPAESSATEEHTPAETWLEESSTTRRMTKRGRHVELGVQAISAAASAATSAASPHKPDDRRNSGHLREDTQDGSERPTLDPQPLVVTTSIRDALGDVLLAAIPSVFSTSFAYLQKPPSSTYYIRLPRPGSLAWFVVKNYVCPDEDPQADMLCDLLECEAAETLAFSSLHGEVRVPAKSFDLRQLPLSAWRRAASEDHSKLLYTLYLLFQSPTEGRSLIVEDVFAVGSGGGLQGRAGGYQSVQHVISVVEGSPQYAKVAVHRGSTSARTLPGMKCNAIANLTQRLFALSGFPTVPDAEVRSVLHTNILSNETSRIGRRPPVAAEPTPHFQPTTVQLASLDTPAPDSTESNNFGETARDAVVRGGLGILMAPLTVGRAVMDATGVTEAIRSSNEAAFRSAFPSLAQEPLLGLHGCSVDSGSGGTKGGNLAVTPHYICFYGGGVDMLIEYDEVKEVQKKKITYDNAIWVLTHVGDQYIFSGLSNRDQAFNEIMQQWIQQ